MSHFEVQAERFGDVRMLRYRVPGFEDLSPQQRVLLYYLSQAALAGRDIFYDQNCKYNLFVRRTLERIHLDFKGERNGPDWAAFELFIRMVWFSNGIHHPYSSLKLKPDFDAAYLDGLIDAVPNALEDLGEGREASRSLLKRLLFDPAYLAKKVNKDRGVDIVADSAVNFYEGVTAAEVEAYHAAQAVPKDPEPPMLGLNSKLVKREGKIEERVWKVGGMYDRAMRAMADWLEKAIGVAENETQMRSLEMLLRFYHSGNPRDFDAYSIAWVQDVTATVDAIHGFIEVYNDPMGMRATYEAIISIVDVEATRRISCIAAHANWFEAASTIDPAHKKDKVVGITGKVIQAVVEAGDCAPLTPIGVNLPNPDWIRERHGSKSVNLANIVSSYNQVKDQMQKEFCFDQAEYHRAREFGELSDNLHTDLHEVIGHASGRLNPGVGTPKETLRNYSSTLEEARADLVALYFIMDPKMVELGLMPSLEVGKAAYDHFIRNSLMIQLRRLKLGEQLEEDHMRNRQLIAKWALVQGGDVIVLQKKDGKSYYQIRDYQQLRTLFGRLLREVQRIKSEGDYQACAALVEDYGVIVDAELHQEVLERASRLDMAPYHGFLQPQLTPVLNQKGEVCDAEIAYPQDFATQMHDYSATYSFLPTLN